MEKLFKSEADLARKLIITACGLVTIDHSVADSLEGLFERLEGKRWSRRRVNSLYYGEANKIHFREVMDLLALIRERDEATFQSYMLAIIAEFVGVQPGQVAS